MENELSAEYGRFDDISEEALRLAWNAGAKAVGALVIIVGDGPGSSGFSVSMVDPSVGESIPRILRDVADGIEKARAKQ